MARPQLVLHLPGDMCSGAAPLPRFYARLRDELPRRGVGVRIAAHDRLGLLAEVVADEDIHIAHHGSLRHPRLLNAGVAYVFPFWNLDPWGIRALSSIAAEPFDPAAIDGAEAQLFFRSLVRRWVLRRQSRGAQPEAATPLPAHAIAVFLQGDADRMVGETLYLDRQQMVAALLARNDPRPILIKPHPLDDDPATLAWLGALGDSRLRITQANIHDMLAVADVAVTINSAVGIEAMLHRVPTVLCGQSDFHHAAVTVRTASGMDGAIAEAEGRSWPFARFIHWYFRQNCLDAGSPGLPDDTLARIARTGFDGGRLLS